MKDAAPSLRESRGPTHRETEGVQPSKKAIVALETRFFGTVGGGAVRRGYQYG